MAKAAEEKGEPGSPSRSRGDESSREMLLKAASEILSERTTLKLSLGEISRRSGLNSALIAYYFGNKEGLLLALVERDAAVGMAGLAHFVEMDIPADEKMRIHISGLINAYYRSPYLNRLLRYLIDHGVTPPSRTIAEIYIKPVVSAYAAILAQGEREGVFRACDPMLFYFSLVGACDYIFHAMLSLKDFVGSPGVTDDLRQRYITHVTEMCMIGLSPSQPAE